MIEDLHKLVKNSTKMHELNKPIVLDDDPEYYASFQVRLAPLELTKIPALRYMFPLLTPK
jgi:hypothetical protein